MAPARMAFPIMLFLLLLAVTGSSGARRLGGERIMIQTPDANAYCSGWVTNTASNNIQGWIVTPPECQGDIKKYMEGGQYLVDFGLAVAAAGEFLQTFEPTDGKDAMVFDIDDTLLSLLPYYRQHSYGGEAYNATLFNDYVDKAAAPALKPTLALYKKLQAEKWALLLITGRDEAERQITVENLKTVGFSDWTELVLRQPAQEGVAAAIYKAGQRAELETTKGYTIRSCIGDQWSDCEGGAAGNRTFKLPNPMYFIA